MPRLARCTLAEIAVQGAGYGRRMSRGLVVDLDERVAPGLTLEGALGRFATTFEPVAPPPVDLSDAPRGADEE